MTVATCPASRLSACADGQVGSDEMRSAPTCPHDYCWHSLEECNPDASNDRATDPGKGRPDRHPVLVRLHHRARVAVLRSAKPAAD